MTDQLLTEAQVADWFQIPWATLKDWRLRGTPTGTPPLPWVKVGAQIRYRQTDVETWLDAVASTAVEAR